MTKHVMKDMYEITQRSDHVTTYSND